MKLFNIALVNMKRFLKTPQIIGVILMQAIFMVMFMFVLETGSSSPSTIGDIGVINGDTGIYSSELINSLESNYKVNILENEEELQARDVVVIIQNNYSKTIEQGIKPVVEIKGAEGDAIILSIINDIEKFNNEKLKGIFIESYNEDFFSFKNKKNEDNTNPIFFVMVCYFLLIGGSTISEDIMKLKHGNVLKRALTTSNSSYTIIGGLFLGILILQGGITSIIYLIASIKVDFGISIISAIGIILAFSALSTSICLFTTRISKNQALASMIGIVYAVIAFIFMFLDMFEVSSGIISKISMLFPFHWVIKAITEGSILISIGMILLMAGVFFTAGGFKYKNFISEL